MVDAINGIRSAKPIVEKAKETAESEPAKTRIADFTNAIEIKGLGLKYDENEYVVKDLDLTFKRGGKYAILAPSGYGKTSIARALAMEFAEFDGSITMDGKDIRSLDTHDYNKILRYVRQDPFLFSDTALNNLAFFDGTPDPALLSKVLRLTRVDEFLADAEALNRQISNTSGLSGGQKQRIVLARALLHSPKVLVLDEITSGIDLENACNILADIFNDKELTCISITHENDERFLGHFDKIFRLNV
jgi:ABC-type transport system involved in cytochrome bd biosynthesis fused ATPase/permease subunit